MLKFTNSLIPTLILSCLTFSYSDVAEALNMGFQTEIKLNNNDGINDNFSIFNTSDSGSDISITKVVFTLGENAELDTTSHGSPTLASGITNSHWGGGITASGNQGLTTNLSSLPDAATTLTFDFTSGEFNPGEGFALNIDFDKRSSANDDPVGGDWSNAQLVVTFAKGSSTDDLTYKYNSATINTGNKKSFPNDSKNGDTIASGQFCSPSNPDTCAYDTLGYASPYAQFAEVPFEFSPSIGIFLSLGLFGFPALKNKVRSFANKP